MDKPKKSQLPTTHICFQFIDVKTGYLSIEQKIGVNLDRILFNPEIVLQLALVAIELLVKRLCFPEVVVQHLQSVQNVGHFRHQLSLWWITLLLRAGFLSSMTK